MGSIEPVAGGLGGSGGNKVACHLFFCPFLFFVNYSTFRGVYFSHIPPILELVSNADNNRLLSTFLTVLWCLMIGFDDQRQAPKTANAPNVIMKCFEKWKGKSSRPGIQSNRDTNTIDSFVIRSAIKVSIKGIVPYVKFKLVLTKSRTAKSGSI